MFRKDRILMHVGIMKIKLHLATGASLKDKRSIVQSTSVQIRNRFQVAVAEVDKNELWQIAVIGIVCVSNSSRRSSIWSLKMTEASSRTKLWAVQHSTS